MTDVPETPSPDPPKPDVEAAIRAFIYWISANEFTDPEHMLVCAEWRNLCGAIGEPMTMAGTLFRKRSTDRA